MNELDCIRQRIERFSANGDVGALRRLLAILNKLAADVTVALVLLDPGSSSVGDLTSFHKRELGSGLEMESSPPAPKRIEPDFNGGEL